MKSIHALLALLLTLAFWSQASAATLANAQEARAFADQVMAKVGANQLDGAITDMKKYTIVPDAEVDASLGQFKLQLPAIAQRFGASAGTEFVREDRVGESLVRLTYIHRFEKHAMRWLFFFYRGPNGWVLNTFRFDDNILALFP